MANLQEYISSMLARHHVEMLVHGNMLKDEAISLSKLVETTLNPAPLTQEELLSHRALIVAEGVSFSSLHHHRSLFAVR